YSSCRIHANVSQWSPRTCYEVAEPAPSQNSRPRGGVGQRSRRPPAARLMSREGFMRLIARAAVIAAGLALVAMSSTSAAWAQQPSRLRGQIEKADGAMLTLKTRDGGTLNVKLADDARVAGLNKATLADIKQDTFIG